MTKETITDIDKKIEEIAKSLSVDGARVVSDVKKITRKFISTGNPLVDWVFGRGLPVGRVIELFGEEGVGKSTLAYQILAQVYHTKGIPILFDAEESFDSERGMQLGLKKVMVLTPNTIEQAFKMLEQVMSRFKSDEDFGVVVWDSLTATPPESVLKGKEEIGARARAVSWNLQRTLTKFVECNLSLIILNQVRSVIGTFALGHREYESASARALRHEAVIRAELRKVADVKDKDKLIVGYVIELFTIKNKIVNPWRRVKLMLFFNTGFSVPHSVIINALDFGIVKAGEGGWYSYENKKFRLYDLSGLTKNDFDEILKLTLEKLDEQQKSFYRKVRLPSTS